MVPNWPKRIHDYVLIWKVISLFAGGLSLYVTLFLPSNKYIYPPRGVLHFNQKTSPEMQKSQKETPPQQISKPLQSNPATGEYRVSMNLKSRAAFKT